MKQHITEEQLGEINRHQAKRLKEWYWKTQPSYNGWKASFGLLSIGQMIEFLFDNNAFIFAYDTEGAWLEKSQNIVLYWGWENKENNKPELCDVLWSAVKEVLNG